MNKIFLRSFLLAVVFILLKPPKTEAQPSCPTWIYNNASKVGLVNDYIYSTFSPGTYYVTLTNVDFGTGQLICYPPFDQPMQITKVPNLSSEIAGAPAVQGILISFPAGYCGGSDLPNLQQNSTSLTVKTTPAANPFLALDFTESYPDFCDYTVVPVVWGPFSSTVLGNPNRVRLNWSTYTEQNVHHFSIEKSVNGITWYKIGQVAAVGNSNAQNFYQFIDNYPSNLAYYRIKSVDFDCSVMYTLILRVTCSSCGTGLRSPTLPADCAPPGPYIQGPAAICDPLTGTKAYRLLGMKGNATVTWSLYPSYLANLTQVSRILALTPTGNPGRGTLTATVVKNGVTTSYSMYVTFGIPEIWVWGSGTLPTNCQMGQFTATVSMLPGTNAWDYSWYQDGWYIGSGDHYTWNLYYPVQTINYQVRWNGPCGTSIYSGVSNGGIEPWKGTKPKAEPNYIIAPNPARTNIMITRRIPPCENPPFEPWKSSSPKPKTSLTNSQTVIVKVFDMNGNLRKTTKVNVTDTRIEIRAGDLAPGMYYVHIIESGKEEETLKVWLEK